MLKAFLYISVLLLCFAPIHSWAQEARDDRDDDDGYGQPNIVVILVDDLGYGDLGLYGNPAMVGKTPNIDQLAREGTRFTSFYAAASLCTPSRTGLLSGRFPVRAGMEGSWRVFLAPNVIGGLPQSVTTLAEALQVSGYNTGMTGKWHQGANKANHLDASSMPGHQGFNYTGLVSPTGQFSPCAGNNATLLYSFCQFYRSAGGPNDHVTQQPWKNHSIAERQVTEFKNFVNQPQHTTTPFLWYHSFFHVHTPIGFAQTGPYAHKSGAGFFGDEIMEMDGAVGEIMALVRTLKRKTLVFFSSDNGPYQEDFVFVNPTIVGSTTAKPLKGGKGQTWEGGHRVPAIAWGPGLVRANAVTDEVVSALDIFPTAVTAAGGNVATFGVDGRNLLPFLKPQGKTPSPWKNQVLPFFCGTHLIAARYNEFKIHYATQNFIDMTGYPVTPFPPTPTTRCHGECCPYNPATIPASVCMCDTPQSLTIHNPPLLFNLHNDIHEDHALTPSNYLKYWQTVHTINARVAEINATIDYSVHNQIDDPVALTSGFQSYVQLFNPNLVPCCPDTCGQPGHLQPTCKVAWVNQATCTPLLRNGSPVFLPCDTDPNP
jgi:arylsulfatase A-like enzyme